MRRVTLFALALLVPLVGCMYPHTRRPAAVYRPGADKPTTAIVRYDAQYGLTQLHRDGTPLLTAHVEGNQLIGFRQLPDKSIVAVAGQQTFPLPDGEFAWFLVPGSDGSWGQRAAEDRERIWKGARDTLGTVLMLPALLLMCAGKGWG